MASGGRKMPRWMVVFGITTLLLPILVTVGASIFFVVSFGKALQPITDAGRYEEIRSRWHADYVQHFPQNIPKDATDVKFYFSQHFPGQGGMQMQLPCTLPPDRIKELIRDAKVESVHKDYVPDVVDWTSGPPLSDFPKLGLFRFSPRNQVPSMTGRQIGIMASRVAIPSQTMGKRSSFGQTFGSRLPHANFSAAPSIYSGTSTYSRQAGQVSTFPRRWPGKEILAEHSSQRNVIGDKA